MVDGYPGVLPPPLAALHAAFSQAGHRFVLVAAAARSLAAGEDMRSVRRFDFVTDADPGTVRRVVQRTPDIQRDDERRPGADLWTLSHGDVRVGIRPLRGRTDSRRASAVARRDPLVADLAGREVTVHAVAIDEAGRVVDPYGGMADFAAGRLQTILTPADLGRESPRWMLRLARHVAYYGFSVDPQLVSFARRNASSLLDIKPEVWREDLERALVHRHPDQALVYLQQAGILPVILPEVAALVGFERSCPVHHKDLFEHTRLVVQRTRPDAVQRWTALFHDIGKVATRTVDDRGTVHFFRHEDLSAHWFRGIAARLAFPTELAARIEYLIASHSRVNLYTEEWTESAIRRLIAENGDNLQDLLDFSRADITSRREERVEHLRALMDDLEARIAIVRTKDAREPALPSGIGHLIMERFGLPPGPTVGLLRKRLEQAVEAGELSRGLSVDAYLDTLSAWVATDGLPETAPPGPG